MAFAALFVLAGLVSVPDIVSNTRNRHRPKQVRQSQAAGTIVGGADLTGEGRRICPDCEGGQPPQVSLGACCSPAGSCSTMKPSLCVASGGYYGGTNNECPATCFGSVPSEMRLYQTSVPVVTTSYAAALASAVFGLYGSVTDEIDAVQVTRSDSEERLSVYRAGGGFLYENRDKLFDPSYNLGTGITEPLARQFAADFLTAHGLLPAEAVFLYADLISAKLDTSEYSVPNHWHIRYGFQIDAGQGLGPPKMVTVQGALIDVMVGNFEILGLNWTWRHLQPAGTVQTFDVPTAASIANQSPGFSPVLPIQPFIAYNLQAPTEPQSIVEPHYVIPTTSEEDHGGAFSMAGSMATPRVTVVPPAGTAQLEGLAFTISATVVGGTPPYQFVWSDMMGAKPTRGGDPSVPLSLANPATFALPRGNHFVEVGVTDANGVRADAGTTIVVVQDPALPSGSGGMACPDTTNVLTRKFVSGGGWSTLAEITANDGLRLNDLSFEGKLLGKDISVPYYKVQTVLTPLSDCELKYPAPDTGNCRSHLMEPGIVAETNPWFTFVSACYCVDHLPDGPVQLSGLMYVCQDYMFKPKRIGCSPKDSAECAPYSSSIDYRYEPPPLAQGNILISMNTFHRFNYDVRYASNIAAFYKDADDWTVWLPSFGGIPLATEEQEHFMANLGNPGDKDNYHQAAGVSSITIPGCSGVFALNPLPLPLMGGGDWRCNHLHYRWGAALGPAWGGGKVFPGPAQTVSLRLFPRHFGETDPPGFDITRLYCAPGQTPACNHEVFNLASGSDLVLWEEVYGTLQEDSFTAAHRFFR
jgi:hypothetical protein